MKFLDRRSAVRKMSQRGALPVAVLFYNKYKFEEFLQIINIYGEDFICVR